MERAPPKEPRRDRETGRKNGILLGRRCTVELAIAPRSALCAHTGHDRIRKAYCAVYSLAHTSLTTRPATSLHPTRTTPPHLALVSRSRLCYVSGPVLDRIVLVLDEKAPKDRVR